MKTNIQASASSALLGSLPKKLRAVTASFSEEDGILSWNSYFYEKPTEEELEDQRLAVTYFLANFDLDQINNVQENFAVIPYPIEINTQNTNLIYHAAEPGYTPLPVQQVLITYGNILASGLQALNGFAEPHLHQVWIQFDHPFTNVKWHAVFDQEPDQRDIQIQEVAANRFASAFGAQSDTFVHQLSEEDIPKEKDRRLIFERKNLNYVDK